MKTIHRRQASQLMLSSMAAAAVMFAFSPPASADAPKPDADLLRLEAALDAAGPQSELNIASQNISEYWDKKLAEVEEMVTRKLADDEQVQFSDLKEKWIAYRKQEVDFIYSLYAGGTIRGFMASGAYSQFTEQRVRNMESLLEGALKPRVDNA